MAIPTPKQLGLPSKFSQWRKSQWQAIQDGLESVRRFVAQVQRTGAGKTLTYMTQAHLATDSRIVINTATKGLQDQLIDDWGEFGVADIRGKSSYTCDGLPGHTCEEGSISKCMYKGSSMCQWSAAMHAAKETRILSTNYPCWISSNKYGQGFGKFDLMICDEAHNAPAEVAKAMRIQLSDREMSLLKRDWPEHGLRGDIASWKHWAAVSERLSDKLLAEMKEQLDMPGVPKQKLVNDYRQMKNLDRKLADIATCRPEKWIVDEWTYGYQFDPIEASAYAERILFRGIDKVILTSGTIRPKTLEMLGIGHKDYEFFDYPSNIDPARSPLIHLQTKIRVNANTPDWEKKLLVKWIDRIIESRHDRKGIIHTANFKLRDFIMANSKYGPSGRYNCMVTNRKGLGETTSEVIAQFKAMTAPAVLVSPSVTTGYDFPYDACRYQIIAKLPYDNVFSKLEQARTEIDPQQSAYKMLQSFMQAVGRGDRAEDDMQEVFVLDENIATALWRNKELVPSWLPAYMQTLNEIPPPLELNP